MQKHGSVIHCYFFSCAFSIRNISILLNFSIQVHKHMHLCVVSTCYKLCLINLQENQHLQILVATHPITFPSSFLHVGDKSSSYTVLASGSVCTCILATTCAGAWPLEARDEKKIAKVKKPVLWEKKKLP